MLQWRVAVASGIGRSRAGAIWGFRRRGLSEESAASQEVAPTQGVAPIPTGRTADPAIHSSEPLGADAEAAAISTAATGQPPRTQPSDTEPVLPIPSRSSRILEHTEVGQPSKPNTQQRRSLSTNQAQPQPNPDDFSCAGLDGSPWPDNAEDLRAQERAQEADNKDYFKGHKASPLSELEFVDSRKPITQATTSPIMESYYGGGDAGVLVWKPEQLDTAEGSMRRATEIWMSNKMRGDPESPHGRILRALRGENW